MHAMTKRRTYMANMDRFLRKEEIQEDRVKAASCQMSHNTCLDGRDKLYHVLDFELPRPN